MDNIFNLDDVTDLPMSLRPVPKFELNEIDQRVLYLMELAQSELSITQLIVGIFRKYGIEKKARSLSQILIKLSRNGLIEKKYNGLYMTYSLKKGGNE